MYGHFNLIIKGFICKRFGESSWELIATQCGCDRDFKDREHYTDATTQELIDTAVQVLTLDREQFLFLAGEHYLDELRIKHDEILRNLGENMLQFLQNVDYLHTYAMADYQDINMPSFRCEADSQADNMVVHYYSFRPGLYPLVEGILHAVAHVYFKSDLAVTVISRTIDEVSEHGSSRHHVIFNLKLTKIKTRSEAPPTLIAHTSKGVEKQILKTDIDRVLQRLREIRVTQGEEAMPLNKSKVARAKWRSLAKMSVLYSGFVPQYPMTLTFNAKAFCDVFPYHIVFNRQMVVVHSGIKLQELMPGIRALRAHLPDFCILLHPTPMAFTFENVTKFINTPFILRTQPHKMQKLWGKKPMVKFRGQMLMADKEDHIIYLCSPYVRCLHDLEERNIKLADIPVHDVTRDMLWVELMTRMRRGHGDSSLSRRNSVAVGISGMIAHAGEDDFNSNDPMVLRRLLLAARQDLADERKQKEEMSKAFLPPAYLRGIQEGETDQAGRYQLATVLFCDVVHFAQILVHCSPSEVVHLLTDLHQKFNRVCRVHQSFRVEAIGDAYMVVSGAPDTVESHPERMANTALGMIIAAREVHSPYDYGDEDNTAVQIRVGLCTGPVVCGVVGDVTPRCLVFGPAVNMASRLESHGVAGRVHTNQETKEILAKRGFRIEKRGTIDLRGMGRVKTFFVESNTRCSEYEIMGRQRGSRGRTANGVSVTFINDGRFENPGTPHGTNSSNSPLLSSNKVSPTNAIELGSASTVRMVYSDNDALVNIPQPLKAETEIFPTRPHVKEHRDSPTVSYKGTLKHQPQTVNGIKESKPANPEKHPAKDQKVETLTFTSRNETIHKKVETVTFASRNETMHTKQHRQEGLAEPCRYNSINQIELAQSNHIGRQRPQPMAFTNRNNSILHSLQTERAKPNKPQMAYRTGRHEPQSMAFATRNDNVWLSHQVKKSEAAKPEIVYQAGRQTPEPMSFTRGNTFRPRGQTKKKESVKSEMLHTGRKQPEPMSFASRNTSIRMNSQKRNSEQHFAQIQIPEPLTYSAPRQFQPDVFTQGSREAGADLLVAHISRKSTVRPNNQRPAHYTMQTQDPTMQTQDPPTGSYTYQEMNSPSALPAEGVLCELIDVVSKINQPVGWAMKNEMIRQGFN